MFNLNIPDQEESKNTIEQLAKEDLTKLRHCAMNTPSGEIWYHMNPHPWTFNDLVVGANDWHSEKALRLYVNKEIFESHSTVFWQLIQRSISCDEYSYFRLVEQGYTPLKCCQHLIIKYGIQKAVTNSDPSIQQSPRIMPPLNTFLPLSPLQILGKTEISASNIEEGEIIEEPPNKWQEISLGNEQEQEHKTKKNKRNRNRTKKRNHRGTGRKIKNTQRAMWRTGQKWKVYKAAPKRKQLLDYLKKVSNLNIKTKILLVLFQQKCFKYSILLFTNKENSG